MNYRDKMKHTMPLLLQSNKIKVVGGQVTHGQSRTPEYKVWIAIKERCYNPNSEKYSLYGGRGIRVCDRWRHSFQNFINDMGKRPSPKHSLDRFPNNNTGHYEKENCRWATQKEQTGNTRKNIWIECGGQKMIQADWARYLGLRDGTLCKYLRKMTIDQVVEKYKK